MKDIIHYETFIKIEPINKGWSSDKKYYIETINGKKLLLRVADISEYERKSKELDVMKRISALGINMSQPLDFGMCNSGKSVFQLLTWCEGDDAEVLLPSLTETEQYELGLKAGRILKRIHAIETYSPSSAWSKSFGKKINGDIKDYKNCGMTFNGDEWVISFVQNNYHLMDNRPMCLTHGDFSAENLIISPAKELYVIDFQRYRTVDPYYCINSIMNSVLVSPHFATGQIHGYFDGEPPANFWSILSFYMATMCIRGLPLTIPLGQEKIDYAYRIIENILEWFDNMNNPVPTWYLFMDQAITERQQKAK